MSHSTRHKRRRSRSNDRFDTQMIANGVLLILFALLAGIASYTMYAHNILAFRHVNVIYTAVLVVVFLVCLLLTLFKKGKHLVTVLLVLFSIVVGVSLFAFKSLVDVADNINKTASYSEIEMKVVVPANSSISDVSELTNVQAPTSADESNINALIANIKSEKGVELTVDPVDSYQSAYENLINGSSQAMVLNSSYSSLLELSYNDYESNLKTIYTYKIKKAIEDTAKTTDKNVFNIYISGIDTSGAVSTVSRSDVNLILTVNMNTHKILMTTTPRDSYVRIPDGGADQYDKLTHAGIYGIETSVKTLENLYDIPINYYARLNFTSFVKLINALGGVTVYNDQAFTSLHGNYNFGVGNINLTSGEEALGFVRERYS